MLFATVRDTKGQGNAAIYVRGRRLGQYWNFTTAAWQASETVDCKVFLTEYTDSDVLESRYEAEVPQPADVGTLEYVQASTEEVIAEQDWALSTLGGLGAQLSTVTGNIINLQNSILQPPLGLGVTLLGARMLAQVRNANAYKLTDTVQFMQGDDGFIYFQLLDLTVDVDANPPYRRYVSAPGSALTVTFQSVDTAKTVQRSAELAFPLDDRSIWRIRIFATDTMVGTRDMKLALNEGGRFTYGYVKQALSISSQDMSL